MKNKNISINYNIYFIACILMVLLCSMAQGKNILIITTIMCQIIYLLLNARKIRYGFLFAIANITVCGILYIINKNYGSACYNLLFILPMLIYGYYKIIKDKEFKINILDNNTRIYIISVFITLIIGTAIILKIFGGRFVIFDSINIVGSFFAIVLVSLRYIEQWPLLILINLSGVITWGIFTFENIINLPTFIIWIICTINCIYGQLVWNKTLHK